ncbi:hypothetical protein IFM58399_05231 [Aspergillus lentulus]|uniref:uncharacterized protein n=1 Tax=Aspergillus lentulus TaxID=293939 RepID=UPI00139348C9|nr:uncharacterized protein IFM58399_05231 [Aspergillus lentulus]GFF38426.1 hypothetical protein IFM58399_05231 [Aspergillus lentulus]GFF71561.1 hypothetical protein IFM62136_08115 [Aspergillus lentulus]
MHFKQPSERPYEAKRYTYLTDTEGLSAIESNEMAHKNLSEKKKAYESLAKAFEAEDKEARSAYNDSGCVTEDGFKKWAEDNRPDWSHARSQLHDSIVHLHMISRAIFGKPYDDQVEKGNKEDGNKAMEAGFFTGHHGL